MTFSIWAVSVWVGNRTWATKLNLISYKYTTKRHHNAAYSYTAYNSSHNRMQIYWATKPKKGDLATSLLFFLLLLVLSHPSQDIRQNISMHWSAAVTSQMPCNWAQCDYFIAIFQSILQMDPHYNMVMWVTKSTSTCTCSSANVSSRFWV